MEQNNSNGQTMKPNREYVKCAAGFGLGNKNDMAVLGYLITQTFTVVYKENKCIAIPLYKLSSCTGVARSTIWDSVIRLEAGGCIEVERPKVRMKGSATTYRVCQWVIDKVAERKGGKAAKIVKRNENMDQDSELQRQNQSLQERVDELTHQLDEKDKRIAELQEARKANDAGMVYDEVPDEWRAQTVEILQNDGRTVTRTKGEQFDIEMEKAGKHPVMRLVDAFGIFNQMRKEIEELKRENAELKKAGPNVSDEALVQENEALVQKVAKLEEVAKDKHNKFMASNNENFAYRNKIGGLQDEIRELKAEMAELEKKYKAAVQELDELKGAGGMVTVEPGEPYKVMKVDEFMQELSSIKNRN